MSRANNSGYGPVGTVNTRTQSKLPSKRIISVARDHIPGGTPISVEALGAWASGSAVGVTVQNNLYNKWWMPGQTISVRIFAEPHGGLLGSNYTFSITMDYLQVQIQGTPKKNWTTTEAVTPQTLNLTTNYTNAKLAVVNPPGGKFTIAGDAVPVKVEVVADEWFRGVGPLTTTVKVAKVKPTITVSAPKAVAIGTKISDAIVVTTAPEALQVTLAPAGTTVLSTATNVQVTASFAGDARFAAADPVIATIKVAAKPVIAWPPLANVVVDTPVNEKILLATITPTGLPIVFNPAGGNLGVVGEATLSASFAGNADHPAVDPVTAKIIVTKDKPKIEWRPLPVLANTAPQQFAPEPKAITALGSAAAPSPVMIYAPLPTVAVGAAGSLNVKVSFNDTTKYDKNELTAPIKIVADRAAMGREAMLTGDAWKGPQSDLSKALLKKWNEDDTPTGLKKTAQKVMSDLKGMTADELIAHMDDLINPGGNGAIGTRTDDPATDTFPNYIWELPNGLQVRFKPKGDGKPPVTVPPRQMFCVEGKTCNGPSNGPGDVAFKVTSDGNPGAYGPGQTHLPPPTVVGNSQSNTYKEYMQATIATTHLAVKPKLEQTITWDNPPDITVGDTLATTLATVKAEDSAALEFFDNADVAVTKDTVLVAGTAQVLKVKGKETKRYLASAAVKTVTLNVNKKAQAITWNPAVRTVKAGDALGATLLAATAPAGTPAYQITGRSDAVNALTVLPAGTYTIIARMTGNDTYLDAVDVPIEVKVERSPQTIEWQPAKTEVQAGSALGAVLNAQVTPSNVKPAYQAVGATTQAVTAETVLPAGDYKVTATAVQSDLFLAATPVTKDVTIARQVQTVEWNPPRTEIAAGSALGDALNARVTPSGAKPVYQIVGGTAQTVTEESKLAADTYRIAASAPQTDLFLAAAPVEATIKIARQPQTITWRPAKAELAAGTALGDFLNGSINPAPGQIVYKIDGGDPVTAGSVLKPETYRIIATAEETTLLLAAEPVTHEIKILPPAEKQL